MKIFDCDQYSEEWWKVSSGHATVSELNRILTPLTLKPSKSVDVYAAEVAASVIIGRRDEGDFKSYWMDRGSKTESEARDWYSMVTGNDITEVGHIVSDGSYAAKIAKFTEEEFASGTLGASPDGLVGKVGDELADKGIGGVEIKCPKPGTLVSEWIETQGKKVPLKYQLQIAGSLLITGCAYWDYLAYVPGMRPLMVRTSWDDVQNQMIEIDKAVLKFDSTVKGLVEQYYESIGGEQ